MAIGKHSFNVSKYILINFYDFLVIFRHNFSRDQIATRSEKFLYLKIESCIVVT